MGAYWKYRMVVLLKRLSKVVLSIVVLALCLLVNCTVVSLVMFGDRSSFEGGLGNYEGIPEAASDINVFKNDNISGMFLADFEIGEDEFVRFAESEGWDLDDVSGSEHIFVAEAYFEKAANPWTTIRNGLYYSKRARNGGGVTVGYDRKGGRGYISSSSR